MKRIICALLLLVPALTWAQDPKPVQGAAPIHCEPQGGEGDAGATTCKGGFIKGRTTELSKDPPCDPTSLVLHTDGTCQPQAVPSVHCKQEGDLVSCDYDKGQPPPTFKAIPPPVTLGGDRRPMTDDMGNVFAIVILVDSTRLADVSGDGTVWLAGDNARQQSEAAQRAFRQLWRQYDFLTGFKIEVYGLTVVTVSPAGKVSMEGSTYEAQVLSAKMALREIARRVTSHD